MKTKLILFVLSSPLLLAAPALRAQDNLATNLSTQIATNISAASAATTNAPSPKSPKILPGEQLLLSPGLKSKLKLTDAQQTELKPIEDDFANTSQEYKVANQPRIEAALEANRQARTAKNNAQIQAARTQLQQVWAGLEPYRVTHVNRIKPLLTPEQLKILENSKNQGRGDPAAESDDLSAK